MYRFRLNSFDSNGAIFAYWGTESPRPRSILVWGAASGELGPLNFNRVLGKLDSVAYINLLKENVVTEFTAAAPCQLLHDHFPVFRSRKVREFVDETPEIELIDFPAMSPDLSIMEHFFTLLIRELNQRTVMVSTTEQLWDEVTEVLDEFATKEYFSLQVSNMSLRYSRVIELDGEPLPIV